jgi:hypothetical protein
MIEVVFLPSNCEVFVVIALPRSHNIAHVLIVRKNQERRKVVRHEQE